MTNYKTIDKSNMRQVILDFPNQFRIGWEAAEKSLSNVKCQMSNVDKVLICGMGGSALAGELLKTFLDIHSYSLKNDAGLILNIHKNYDLPVFADQNTLIIASSYSGNTEEVISIYNQALGKKLTTVSLTTGGQLLDLAQKNKKPFVQLPDTSIQPRNSLGYQFAALAYVLFKFGLIKDVSVNLLALAERLKPEELEKAGQELAKKIGQKVPLIYTTQKYEAIAYNWKIRFNETGKSHAFYNVFPELNHNEMVAFAPNPKSQILNPKQFHVIILRDTDDYPRILKRMELTAELIKKSKVEVDFVDIKGDDILTEIFSALVLGDWTAYYLALEQGIDPTPVKIIEKLKKELSGY